jgi:hypothetical protein
VSKWFLDKRAESLASNPRPNGEQQEMLRDRGANDNHGRAVVRIRFCPNCGVVVNKNILVTGCADERHAESRRSRNNFCVGCGEQLLHRGVGPLGADSEPRGTRRDPDYLRLSFALSRGFRANPPV